MGGSWYRPRDDHGRFIPLKCPVPLCDGELQFAEDRFYGRIWLCNGLIDPEGENKELQACTFSYVNGEPYEPPDPS